MPKFNGNTKIFSDYISVNMYCKFMYVSMYIWTYGYTDVCVYARDPTFRAQLSCFYVT